MINNTLKIICDKLIEQVYSETGIKAAIDTYGEEEIRLIYIADFLSAQITVKGITVLYASEHDEFWRQAYNNEQTWIEDAVKHIILIATNAVYLDSYYDKQTMKLIYYIIRIEYRGKRKVLKKVVTTGNPLSAVKAKRKITTVLNSPADINMRVTER